MPHKNRAPLALSTLKLFAPQLAAEDCEVENAYRISPQMTLKEFFERYFRPVFLTAGRADAKTIAEYRTAVERWCVLTGDPPLLRIDNLFCARFIERDFAMPGRRGEMLSPNTIRKHCGALQVILRIAGPQSERYPEAPTAYGLFGLDDYGRPRPTPFFKKPPKRDKPPEDLFTLGEIRRLIAAAEHAAKPHSGQFSAPAWWRALFRFLYNTGLRRGSALEIRREWIHSGDGFHFLSIPGEAYKQGRPHLFYLSRQAMEAIAEMPATGKIFPWLETMTSLNRHMKRLMRLAEIPAEKYFGLAFHGMRKSLGTSLFGVNQEAARLQLGHESKKTTERHYVSAAQLANSLAAAVGPYMENLPQP